MGSKNIMVKIHRYIYTLHTDQENENRGPLQIMTIPLLICHSLAVFTIQGLDVLCGSSLVHYLNTMAN